MRRPAPPPAGCLLPVPSSRRAAPGPPASGWHPAEKRAPEPAFLDVLAPSWTCRAVGSPRNSPAARGRPGPHGWGLAAEPQRVTSRARGPQVGKGVVPCRKLRAFPRRGAKSSGRRLRGPRRDRGPACAGYWALTAGREVVKKQIQRGALCPAPLCQNSGPGRGGFPPFQLGGTGVKHQRRTHGRAAGVQHRGRLHVTSKAGLALGASPCVYLPTICHPGNTSLFLCLVVSPKPHCSFSSDAR